MLHANCSSLEHEMCEPKHSVLPSSAYIASTTCTEKIGSVFIALEISSLMIKLDVRDPVRVDLYFSYRSSGISDSEIA